MVRSGEWLQVAYNNGTFSDVIGIEGSECHNGQGLILGTLKGHT